jgi:tetratricopeptide (TPR) repeat protein
MAAKKPRSAEITSFLVACAAEADPALRIRKARAALSALPRGSHKAEGAIRALLAHARIDAGDKAGARKEWLAMAAKKLSPVRARIEAGLIAEELGRLDVAEKDYRTATRAASPEERAEVYAVLARFYVRHHRAEEALKLLRRAALRIKNPLVSIALSYVEARISGDPTPLARHRSTLQKKQAKVPLYAYFLGFLNLWDGRTLEAVKTLRGFVSRGVDQMGAWGRELSPELDHARRTILQIEAVARVPMP